MKAIQKNRRVIVPIVVLAGLLVYGIYYALDTYVLSRELVVSGTIEATEIHLGTQMGGQVKDVAAGEGEPVRAGQMLAEIKASYGASAGRTEKIYAPIDGVLLTRAVEPGEIAPAGSTLLVVGDLRSLMLTVYVPEDRYGQVTVGQSYPVSVDSFPGRSFAGRVTRISDKAEFTPRNVQTVQGRKNTVYAVRLALDNADLALKPGMPADVRLGK